MINNVLNINSWLRLLYSFLYGFALCFLSYILFFIVCAQFFVLFIKGEPCTCLTRVGSQIKTFIAAVIAYITFNSDAKPFPFADWPKE